MRLIGRLVRLVILCVILVGGALVWHGVGGRELTDVEKELARPVFAGSVDLDKVRVRDGGPLMAIFPGLTIGNRISFPKGAYDFESERYKALLVHELVHVWQYQNDGWGYIPQSVWVLVTQRDAYVVHYDATKAFGDYDVEEQAEIITEWFVSGGAEFGPYLAELRGSK